MKAFLVLWAIISISFAEEYDGDTMKYPGFAKLGIFSKLLIIIKLLTKNKLFTQNVEGSQVINENLQYEKTFWVSTHFRGFWDQAMIICRSFGMEFVSIDSPEEATSLLSLCHQYDHLFDPWTHIGGITKVPRTVTEYFWIETGKKANFHMNFGPGQPDFAANNEFCLSLGRDQGNYYFNDMPCYGMHSHKFICQTKTVLY